MTKNESAKGKTTKGKTAEDTETEDKETTDTETEDKETTDKVVARGKKAKPADPPADPPAEERSKDAGRSPATVPLCVLASACLVVAVACVALLHQSSQNRAIAGARAAGLAAAQSDAKDLLSYNFRTLDYDLSKARSEMTPDMARSFDDYWRIFRPSVEKSQTQALTQVQVAGVSEASQDHVVVLLFVKMISVNAAHKEPQVDTSWPQLQMRKIGKKWLIDGPRMTSPPPSSTSPSTPPSPSKAPGKSSGKPSHQSSGRPSSGH